MKSVVSRLAVVIAAALAPLLAFQIYAESQTRDLRRRLMEEQVVRLLRFVNLEQQRIVEGANQLLGLVGGIAFGGMGAAVCW